MCNVFGSASKNSKSQENETAADHAGRKRSQYEEIYRYSKT